MDSSYTFCDKINQVLQPDSYQCGAWVCYFLEQRLQNPDTDFNALARDMDNTQNMISNYRRSITSILQ